MQSQKSEILEYTALLLILGLCSYFYFHFHFNPFKQFLVVIAASLSYVVWGTIHHLLRVRLYWHILYEYILVAVLVCLLFAFSLNIL